MRSRLGSADSVVLPVPDRPNSTDERPVFRSAVAEQCIDSRPRFDGNAPALQIVKSGAPKAASSLSVGRISIVCMNRAWYGREQMTRTLMRYFGSQPAKPSKQYSRSRVFR